VARRDYAVVYLRDEDAGYRYVLSYTTARGVRAKAFKDGADAESEVSLLNYALPDLRLLIVQYIGEIEIRYDSDSEYLLHYFLDWPRFLLASDRMAQAWFNTSRLVREDRIKVLRIFVETTLKRRDTKFSEVGLMSEIYGPRWALHPKHEEMLTYYRLVLESLAKSEDLAFAGHAFRLEGGGLKTLADYELEERRHRDNRSRQTVLAILTAVLMLIAGGQLWLTWNPVATIGPSTKHVEQAPPTPHT
jgi:hypothetical protein